MKEKQRRISILCDHVHGTMKAAHALARESGCSEEAWGAVIEGALNAMDIEAFEKEAEMKKPLDNLIKDMNKKDKLVQLSWGDWIDVSQVVGIGLNDSLHKDEKSSDDVVATVDICFYGDTCLTNEFWYLEQAKAARDEVASLVNEFHRS